MKSVCQIVQNVYDVDSRVRRKVDVLVAAGYSVDVLALRAPQGKKIYTLDGATVHTVSLGKMRGSLLRYAYEYVVFFLWAFLKVSLLMRRRRYAVIDVNTLPDFLVFAGLVARWMGAKLVLDMHEITAEFYMSKYGIPRTHGRFASSIFRSASASISPITSSPSTNPYWSCWFRAAWTRKNPSCS